MRTEFRDSVRKLDVVLELRPISEAVLPRDDQLRVGERQRFVEGRLKRLALQAWMVRGDASGGRWLPVAMRTMKLIRLDLELIEVRAEGERTGRQVGLGPFPRTGGALRAHRNGNPARPAASTDVAEAPRELEPPRRGCDPGTAAQRPPAPCTVQPDLSNAVLLTR